MNDADRERLDEIRARAFEWHDVRPLCTCAPCDRAHLLSLHDKTREDALLEAIAKCEDQTCMPVTGTTYEPCGHPACREARRIAAALRTLITPLPREGSE